MIREYFISLLDWCKINVLLVEDNRNLPFKEGEIWWCSIGMNIGEEVFGKGSKFMRPVLIFKKFTANSFLGLPITGSSREGSWYISINLASQTSSIMLNQAKIFDKKRLQRRIETMGDIDFKVIKERFLAFYGS